MLMKEMFIKNTDVKVEINQIIVKDDEAYVVKPSNIPDLLKKGILEFKDIKTKTYVEKVADAAKDHSWEDLIIEEYGISDDNIQDLFYDFPGVWTSLILKRISNAFNYNRPTCFDPTKGYYFVNSITGDVAYCPEEKVHSDSNFDMFAYFATQEEAEYAQSQVYEK